MTAATIRAAPSASGASVASTFQIQGISGGSDQRSSGSSLRRLCLKPMIISIASATVPAPSNRMNSAVTGALAEAASIGDDRDRGARAAIATIAVAAVIPATIAVARTARIDPWARDDIRPLSSSAAVVERVQRHPPHGRRPRLGERLQQVQGAGHADDRHQALERLRREVGVGVSNQRPQRSLGGALA